MVGKFTEDDVVVVPAEALEEALAEALAEALVTDEVLATIGLLNVSTLTVAVKSSQTVV